MSNRKYKPPCRDTTKRDSVPFFAQQASFWDVCRCGIRVDFRFFCGVELDWPAATPRHTALFQP